MFLVRTTNVSLFVFGRNTYLKLMFKIVSRQKGDMLRVESECWLSPFLPLSMILNNSLTSPSLILYIRKKKQPPQMAVFLKERYGNYAVYMTLRCR